ncbi:hypothetical protein MMC30_004561 [Trapelia coarctata]|nr:hypothetical protein [Trapelia coarctata]
MTSPHPHPRIPIPPTYTLTPPLRHRLNSALLSLNAIPHLQAALTHEAQASGWLDAIRARVYELLRSGECTTYAEVMAAIMQEVKGAKRGVVNGVGNTDGGGNVGANGVNGVGLGLGFAGEEKGGSGSGSAFTNGNTGANGNGEGRGRLAVPRRVVEAGVRIVRGVLEEVVEVTGEEGGVGEGR